MLGHSSGRFLEKRARVAPGSDPEPASSFLRGLRFGGLVNLFVARGVRGGELAVALSTTPNSTSANAWPARPFQALPRQIPGSIGLRAFRSVSSGAKYALIKPHPENHQPRCRPVDRN